MQLPSLDSLDLAGRRVFVRVDFNAPVNDGQVTDDTRIVAALPTIHRIAEMGGRVILGSHRGRPNGEHNPDFSLEPIAEKLAEHINADVILTDEPVGDSAKKLATELRDGQILMLENLRFHPGEKANDAGFAASLRELADAYVCDAFGVVHRKHASVYALPKLFPEKAAGLLVQKEVQALSKLLSDVEKPYVAVIGGAKVAGKVDVLDSLIDRVDVLLIGGAMANTFLAARGVDIANSRHEPDKIPTAASLLRRASSKSVIVKLPTDVVCAESIESTDTVTCSTSDVKGMIFDIGPATRHDFLKEIEKGRTLFWNGPMGVFEKQVFAAGTKAIAQGFASNTMGLTVIGGGDSAAAAQQMGIADKIDHLSTGGGASLEFIQGRTLPGLQALQ